MLAPMIELAIIIVCFALPGGNNSNFMAVDVFNQPGRAQGRLISLPSGLPSFFHG